MPRTGNDSLDIREIYESLQWVLPAINPNIGQIEPMARYKRTGLIAYADGTNWNPNTQGAGHYRWDGAAWVKLLEPDDTFTTSINADKVDGNHWRYFESSEQTITSAGSLSLAHGTGVSVKLIQIVLVCKTAEGGYSINDVVGGENLPANTNGGFSWWSDTTNLNIIFGSATSPFALNHKTTGVVFSLTNANWKIIFRTWA